MRKGWSKIARSGVERLQGLRKAQRKEHGQMCGVWSPPSSKSPKPGRKASSAKGQIKNTCTPSIFHIGEKTLPLHDSVPPCKAGRKGEMHQSFFPAIAQRKDAISNHHASKFKFKGIKCGDSSENRRNHGRAVHGDVFKTVLLLVKTVRLLVLNIY